MTIKDNIDLTGTDATLGMVSRRHQPATEDAPLKEGSPLDRALRLTEVARVEGRFGEAIDIPKRKKDNHFYINDARQTVAADVDTLARGDGTGGRQQERRRQNHYRAHSYHHPCMCISNHSPHRRIRQSIPDPALHLPDHLVLQAQ